MQLFRDEIIVRRKKLPDPFWCLASNDAADTNYAGPETVARMAEVESTVGLFRRLVRRTDLNEDLHSLAPDLAAAGLLIQLAAAAWLRPGAPPSVFGGWDSFDVRTNILTLSCPMSMLDFLRCYALYMGREQEPPKPSQT